MVLSADLKALEQRVIRLEEKLDRLSGDGGDGSGTSVMDSRQKTAALEEQLQQSRKMEAIGTLASGIAHDFNNILGAIIGYTETALAHEVPKDSPAQYSLNQVLYSAQKARNLIAQLLTFARKAKEDFDVVAPEALVKGAVDDFKATMPKNIALRTYIRKIQVQIMGDPRRIHQALMHLFENGVESMEDNGGILTVSLTQINVDEPTAHQFALKKRGAYVKFKIQDTGKGIPQKNLEKIFIPFFTTKKTEQGAGMGLSVVQGTVEQHGGAIKVLSDPEKGTIVTVLIPGMASPNPSLPRKSLQDDRSKGDGHILIVDDEPLAGKLVKRMLSPHGYRVTPVETAKHAINVFKKNPGDIDIVMTDFSMPQMDGDELTKVLRKIRPNIPIIICTGYDDEMTQKRLAELEAIHVVQKPILRETLLKLIRKLIDHGIP